MFVYDQQTLKKALGRTKKKKRKKNIKLKINEKFHRETRRYRRGTSSRSDSPPCKNVPYDTFNDPRLNPCDSQAAFIFPR